MVAEAPNQETVAEQQDENGADENQFFDNLEDAVDALDDDSDPEGQPEPQEEAVDEEPEAEPDDGVEVDFNGDKLTLKELKDGYLRQKDYTLKTTEVANERKALETAKSQMAERASVLETALNNLSGYLQSLIPPEPPLTLARTDPGNYQYQMALRQNAIAELSQLVTIKGQVDEHKSAMTEAEFREYQAREQSALVKAMPELADPIKRAAFDQSVRSTAKTLGFTDDEINATADHRVLRLVHLARIGQRAIENRNNASKRVETPKMAKAKSAPVPVNVENRKAMARLAKTGSLRDALAVDFE